MIEPGSFIAFGVLLFALTCALSFVLCAAALLARTRLRRLGPWVERQAGALAIIVPPALGILITLSLVVRSLAGARLGLPDHCPSHGHHLHLCLYHGAVWAREPWAVATLAGACALIVARFAQRVIAMLTARAAVRSLVRVGRQLPDQPNVVLAPSERAFCFVAGVLAPRIFLSSAAWACLGPDERRAVLEHEQAHLAQGDLWRRFALGAMALFGFPVLVRWVLRDWDHATERLCDRRAAEAIGQPTAVAAALVTLARAGADRSVPCAPAFLSPCTLADRVEAVLADEPEGRQPARRLAIGAAVAVTTVVGVAAVLAEPLHHAFETLLGSH